MLSKEIQPSQICSLICFLRKLVLASRLHQPKKQKAPAALETDIVKKPTDSPTLFPNPSSDAVTVVLNNGGQSGIVQLFSQVDGSLVRSIVTNASDNDIQINISDLPKGVYTMKVTNGEGIKSIRLVKL